MSRLWMTGGMVALTLLGAAPAGGQALSGSTSGFVAPVDAVRDADGGILVADAGAHRVERIAPDGSVTTVAGSGATTDGGFSGDGGPATAARLDTPVGVSPLPGGGFLIADSMNGLVRRVGPDGTITTVAGGGLSGHRCPATNLGLGEVRAV